MKTSHYLIFQVLILIFASDINFIANIYINVNVNFSFYTNNNYNFMFVENKAQAHIINFSKYSQKNIDQSNSDADNFVDTVVDVDVDDIIE